MIQPSDMSKAMARPKKVRLDLLVVQRSLAPSRQRAQALIMAGKVMVAGRIIDKPGRLVPLDVQVEVGQDDNPFVGRGGLKLLHALERFSVDPKGRICMDVGASTGGFTHCLLQKGAERVYAIDVGYGQLAWELRNDPRVVVMERTNIRHLPKGAIADSPDLAVIDVSFISLRIVVPAVLNHLARPAEIVALVKPQFEVGKGEVGKGGIVRHPRLHARVIKELVQGFREMGLEITGVVPSPIRGAKGNREFLMHMRVGREVV